MKKEIFVRYILIMFLAVWSSSCGEAQPEQPVNEGAIILIESMSFVPDQVSVTAGQTVIVINNDSVLHSISSQSAENAFDATGEFSTGPILDGSKGFFVVPETALPGDIFYFYSDIYQEGMNTENGQLVVE